MSSSSSKPKQASKPEVQAAAMAWAEFLYDEYMLRKQKQLLLKSKDTKIEPKQQGGEGTK